MVREGDVTTLLCPGSHLFTNPRLRLEGDRVTFHQDIRGGVTGEISDGSMLNVTTITRTGNGIVVADREVGFLRFFLGPVFILLGLALVVVNVAGIIKDKQWYGLLIHPFWVVGLILVYSGVNQIHDREYVFPAGGGSMQVRNLILKFSQ